MYVCVNGGGGYFADVLSYWLVQTLGEGQPQNHTLTSCREEQRNKEREGERREGGQICVLMLIFWSN